MRSNQVFDTSRRGSHPRPVASQSHQLLQRAPVTGRPARWFRIVRAWSPGVLPPLLGSLLLLLVVWLSTRHGPRQPPMIAPYTVLPLLVFYLLGGTIFGYLLYRAHSTVTWYLTLVSGSVLYLLVTLGVIAGPLAVLLCSGLVVWGVVVYIQRHRYNVAPDTVTLTRFGGGYHRSLTPGRAILLPGERTLAVVNTGERQVTCPAQQIEIADDEGVVLQVRAAATIAYRVLPAHAHTAMHAIQQTGGEQPWLDGLHAYVGVALREALMQWAKHGLLDEHGPADGSLTTAVMASARQHFHAQGARIRSVRVHDILCTPLHEAAPADGWLVSAPLSGTSVADTLSAADEPTLPPQRHTARTVSAAPEWHVTQGLPTITAIPVAGAVPVAVASAESLSPEALSDAYEAVRAGHISDPVTIREVAQGFLRVAAESDLNAHFPYDAQAAARILLDRAAALERPHYAAQRSDSHFLR